MSSIKNGQRNQQVEDGHRNRLVEEIRAYLENVPTQTSETYVQEQAEKVLKGMYLEDEEDPEAGRPQHGGGGLLP